MESYPVKVRIEIGPGIPSELQPIKEPAARRAMMKAIHEFFMHGNWPAGKLAMGAHEGVTAKGSLDQGRGFVEPSLSQSHSHLSKTVEEFEFTFRLEDASIAPPSGDSEGELRTRLERVEGLQKSILGLLEETLENIEFGRRNEGQAQLEMGKIRAKFDQVMEQSRAT